MSAPRTERVVDAWALTNAERIALTYYNAYRQDGWVALVAVVTDALADLGEAGRRSERRDRLISPSYVRGRTSIAARSRVDSQIKSA